MFIRSLNKILHKIRLDKSTISLKRTFFISRTVNAEKLPAIREMDKIIGIGQMCATNDKEWNRKQVEEIVKSAVDQNTCVSDVLIFSFYNVKTQQK